jgi:hypothetical protein
LVPGQYDVATSILKPVNRGSAMCDAVTDLMRR